MMVTIVLPALVMTAMWGTGAGAQPLRQELRGYCWPNAGKIHAVPAFAKAGEEGRKALLELAGATGWPDAECGIGALSMLGDERVVPAMVSRLQRADSPRNPHAELLSWAQQLTALSDVPAHRAQLVQAVARHLSGPNGANATAVLGLIDDAGARALIERELGSPLPDRRAHAIFAAALQRDASAMDVVRQAALNQNFQGPSRRQYLALYFLTVDRKTMLDGLAILDELPVFTRSAIARWATQTLCIRSRRSPPLDGLDAHRRDVIGQFKERKLEWDTGPYIVCTDIE